MEYFPFSSTHFTVQKTRTHIWFHCKILFQCQGLCLLKRIPMYWKIQYLLSRIACSTQEVFSLEDSSSECWLIADKNLRISLVLSVLPAPLSPLKEEEKMVCTVPVASEGTLWLATQTLHYWRSGRLGWLEVMVKWSQSTQLHFLNMTSREKHKLSLSFITAQTAFQGTDCIRTHT